MAISVDIIRAQSAAAPLNNILYNIIANTSCIQKYISIATMYISYAVCHTGFISELIEYFETGISLDPITNKGIPHTSN